MINKITPKKIISKMKKSKELLIDIVPAQNRKKIMKLLQLQVGEYSTVSRKYHWLRAKGMYYERKYSRIPAGSIRSNIEKRNSRPLVSMANDTAIEKILESCQYTFDTMLVINNPYRMAPLTALAVFNTQEPCSVYYEVVGDTEEETFSGETDMATLHRVEILGLYPNRENKIRMELHDGTHNVIEKREITIKTDPLPDELCDIVKVRKKTRNSSEPFILISGGTSITTCAFDVSGNIRYYLKEQSKGYGIFPLSNGRFLYQEKDINRPTQGNPHAIQIHEMDYSGRVYKTFYVPKGFHHNATEMTLGGNIIACASTCDENLENAVIELDRTTGEVLKELSMNQLFDDTYIDRLDWAHVNAVSYQEKSQTLLVSMRNIHTIAKIDWKTGKLLWILSHPELWKDTSMSEKILRPVGEIKWFFQQHAVVDVSSQFNEETDITYIMLYDNHLDKRRKVSFFDQDEDSYVSIFRIDERNLTVTMKEKYQFPKSTIRSNGILNTKEQRVFSMGGYMQPEIEENLGLISEMDIEKKEIANEYFVKTGFFSAYPFQPDINGISKPMPITSNYVLGGLEKLDKTQISKKELALAELVGKDDVHNIRICEDIVLIKARDHAIGQVYLVGRNTTYIKDFSETKQTLSVFANMLYAVAVPLTGLDNDVYEIYVNVRGILKNTDKWVEIKT